MADELGAELSLDLDSARREIESFRRDVEDELERAVTTFGDAYSDTVKGLPSIEPEIDTQSITEDLSRAIQSAAETEFSVTADVDALQSEISQALAATDAPFTVDTDPAVAQIEGLFESFHPQLTPEIDTSDLEASLADLSAAGDGLGDSLSGGLSDASLQAQEMSDALSDLTDGTQQAGDGLGTVSNISTTLATAFSAAKGEGRQLISQIGELSPSLGRVLGPTAALTVGFTALFAAGEHSLASIERAQTVLGDSASRIERINVGGLSGSLSDLAIQAGASGGALRSAAANAAQLGLSSGKSVKEVTDFANNVNALALRAVALNPALGEAGSVAERLNLVLGRGGRFLNRYQIDLTSAEITTRALAETGKTAVRDLTSFERSVAGADIAVEKLGNSLGTDFAKGTEQSSVRLRSIRAELTAAFASAGKPLVEPTISGLESLADAATGVSSALGKLGQGVLPVVATGLESLGAAAGVAAQGLGAIPAPLLLIGAGFLGLQKFTGIQIRDLESLTAALHGTAAELTGTFGGRSIAALGALTALDVGLKAAGTSTEKLGVQFITTGAAIGFAFGSGPGAAIGATIGAVAQGVSFLASQEDDLEEATRRVDESFKVAAVSATGMREALFAAGDTSAGLSSSLGTLDISLGKFLQSAGAFQALHVDKDIQKLGLSTFDVARLAGQGDQGLAQFINRAQRSGEVVVDLQRAFAEINAPGSVDELVRNLGATGEQMDELRKKNQPLAQAIVQVRQALHDAGVGATLTGDEYAHLSAAQQRQVRISLEQVGANTNLITAFQATQRQFRAAQKEEFNLFAETNRLSPALVDLAKAQARDATGTIDWTKALRLLGDEAAGVIPELGRLSSQAASIQREFKLAGDAIDSAKQSLPGLGSELDKALGSSFFEDLKVPQLDQFGNQLKDLAGNALPEIDLGQVFDTDKFLGDLNHSEQEMTAFFKNVQTISEAGASNAAGALLALGPDNLGARVAADLAANEPLFRDGMEKALSGISAAVLASEASLDEQKSRIAVLGAALGTDLETQLKTAFQVDDISKIQTPQLLAFIERNGAAGIKGAQELVDAYNREVVTKRMIGFDTKPVEDGIAAAKAALQGANLNQDVDVAMQAAQAETAAKAPVVFAPIPGAIEAVKPEVLAGIGQVGDIIATGTVKTKDQYDAEFRKIVGLTRDIMGDAKKAAEAGGPPLGDAVARSVSEGIDAAENAIGDRPAQLGFRIIDGITYGITHSDADERALQAHIDELLDAANQAAGINSPARLFMPVGSGIDEGIGVGISDSKASQRALTSRIGDMRDGLDGFSGFGANPSPPSGLQPIIQVTLDPSVLGSSVDSSIHVGAVHNYGPDIDSRGQGMVGVLRDLQFTGGSI